MCKIHVAAYIQVNNVKDFTNGGEKIQPILASIFLILQALSTEEVWMVFLAFFVGNLYNKSEPLTKKGMRTMIQSYEKQRELVSKLNVIDDVLCQDSSGDYFKKSTGVHQKFQKLSNRVQYFKESQKGVTEMCELVEEYAKNMQKRK